MFVCFVCVFAAVVAACGIVVVSFAAFVFFAPNFFGEPDNYIKANSLVTPPHIVPEWYFLPFYAILRSITFDVFFIEAKLLGVILMFASIAVLFILPWLDTSKVRSCRFRPIYKWFFWFFVLDCIILGIVGAKSPDDPVFGVEWFKFVHLGQIGTAYYFFHFLILLPVLGKTETPLPLPQSISESVTGGSSDSASGAATAKGDPA